MYYTKSSLNVPSYVSTMVVVMYPHKNHKCFQESCFEMTVIPKIKILYITTEVIFTFDEDKF